MKTFYPTLIVIILLYGCKKTEDANQTPGPTPAISISGVNSITLPDSSRDHFRITVSQSSGEPKEVLLSVSGLPAGVSAVIDTASGFPPFSTTVRFAKAGKVIAATYTATITGRSAYDTATESFGLSVLKFNGWILNDSVFLNADTVFFDSPNAIIFNNNTGHQIQLFTNDSFAKQLDYAVYHPGVYAIPLAGPYRTGLHILYVQRPFNYRFNDDTTIQYVTITNRSANKLSVKIPRTHVSDGGQYGLYLEVDAQQN